MKNKVSVIINAAKRSIASTYEAMGYYDAPSWAYNLQEKDVISDLLADLSYKEVIENAVKRYWAAATPL